MAQARMSPLHFSGGGLLEALGSAFVRFQFRHNSSESAASRQLPAASSSYRLLRVQLLWNLLLRNR
jgi:hypothetical protein